ncbi:hypothetical protein JJJ17_07720 [Paracoccus caeni]|uniref:Phage tail tape measure protein n=1 Tax=Paracoccus caeni TaxID=657651 RepID=A0A934VZZ3_9RHOB|nr:hypothetical protein [Paracoccus caeni]MBK4215808.1 hypothetical protein [Paracoccus caeni]
MRSLQDRLGGIGKNLGAAIATAAATATVALAGLSAAAINAAGEIHNLSRMANATPEEFQGWAAGARTVGIEQEKLSDILKDMNDRVGDFISTGGGPMKDFFEVVAPKVGVTADQFRKLSGPKALQLYVDTLEKANLNQQDMTFYMEAIASDSTLLLPLLQNGGKAMGEYAARAEELGAVMSNRTVRSLAAMKLSLGEVGMVMRGVRNSLGAAFAPILEALARAFVSLMTKGSGLRLVFEGLASAIGGVARFLSSVITIVSSAVAGLWNLAKAGLEAANRFTGVGDALKRLIEFSPVVWIYRAVTGFADLIRAAGGFGEAMKMLGELSALVWKGIADSAEAIPPALSAVWLKIKGEFFGLMADIQHGWSDMLASFQSGLRSMNLNGDFLDPAITSSMRSGTDSLIASTAALTASSEAAQHARDVVNDAFAPAAEKWRQMTDLIADSAAEAEAAVAGSGSGTGLAGAVDKAGGSAKSAKERLTDLQKVMKDLRDEAAKLKATMWMSAEDIAVWENLNKAGVSADTEDGRAIEALTRLNEGMKRLKASSDEWKSSLSDGLRELTKRGSSFRDVLASLATKLGDMLWSKGFEQIWNSGGLGGLMGGFLSKIGLGANANGTKSWEGGWTRLNERGEEIVNLPRGTQIIPHQLSKRMAAASGNVRQTTVPMVIDLRGTTGEQALDAKIAAAGRAILAKVPDVIDNRNKREL